MIGDQNRAMASGRLPLATEPRTERLFAAASSWLHTASAQPAHGQRDSPAIAKRQMPLTQQPGQQMQRGGQPAGRREVAFRCHRERGNAAAGRRWKLSARPMRPHRSMRLVQQPRATCWQTSTKRPDAGIEKGTGPAAEMGGLLE